MDDWQHTPPRGHSTSPTLHELAEYFLHFARRTRVRVDVLPDGEHLRFIEPEDPQDRDEAEIWHRCKVRIYSDPALYAAVRDLLLKRRS